MPDLATLTTPPLLLDSNGKPANGDIFARLTNNVTIGTGVATRRQSHGTIKGGKFLALDGGAFDLVVTPADVGVELVVELTEEVPGGRPSKHVIRRTVQVPNLATVTWTTLVDMVPAVAGPEVVVPAWVAETKTARDEAVVAKDAAVVAKTDAQAAAAAAQSTVELSGALRAIQNKKYKLVAGVIRNDGAVNYWQPLNDTGHAPVNIDSVSTTTSGIVINYAAIGAVKVVSFVAGPDETLASAGFTTGASVGLTSATIELTKTTPYTDFVSYNAATSTWASSGGVFTLTWNAAGYLICAHPLLPPASGAGSVFNVTVTGRGVTVPNSHGVSESDAWVQFRDWAGTLLTTPTADFKAFVSHGMTGKIDPQRLTTTVHPGSNIWFMGVFEVV